METSVADAVSALRAGRAVADLSSWRRVRVRGADAATFLGDLVSGPVAELSQGAATRSLLLSPTGRIRADFTVAHLDGSWLIVQRPDQPEPVSALLAPYVLSADVTLAEDAGSPLAAWPGGTASEAAGGERYAPGALGAGVDVVDIDPVELARRVGAQVVDEEALETWRILDGRARLGPDLLPDSLPHEAALAGAIDHQKGCFLGQEAVARVRNLGHPPRVLLAARSQSALRPGEDVLADGGAAVGTVTSAAADPDGGHAGIVRVRWDARDAALFTAAGAPLSVRPAA